MPTLVTLNLQSSSGKKIKNVLLANQTSKEKEQSESCVKTTCMVPEFLGPASPNHAPSAQKTLIAGSAHE